MQAFLKGSKTNGHENGASTSEIPQNSSKDIKKSSRPVPWVEK